MQNGIFFPFIALEGIDGSGKTSQFLRLRSFMEAHKIDAFFTRKPTDRQYGKQIRRILKGEEKTTSEELRVLFARDDYEAKKYEVEILKKKPIVSDRDTLVSNLVYGVADGDDIFWIFNRHKEILGKLFFIPDLILILDVDPSEAARRQTKQTLDLNRKELEIYEKDLGYRKKIRKEYLEFSNTIRKLIPGVDLEIKIINGWQTEKHVFKCLWGHISEILNERTKINAIV